MACTYKYKGVEYSSKSQLIEALAGQQVETTPVPTPLRRLIEFSGDFNNRDMQEAMVRHEAIQRYGTDEFLERVESDGEVYIAINEELFNQQISDIKLFGEQEVNVAKELEKFKKGQPIQDVEMLQEYLEAMINEQIYQKVLSNIKFPASKSNTQLLAALKNFVTKLGIGVETMDTYLKNYEQRHGAPTTVNALADMLTQTIALANNATLEDFTEEVAHFALEYFNDSEQVDKMMASVQNTNMYKQYESQYRQLYSKTHSGEALENKVRKEVLGKILAERILDNFSEQPANAYETGIFATLKKLINSFLDLFNITDGNRQFFEEFGKTLDDITGAVTDNSVNGKFAPFKTNEVYYSASKEDKALMDNLKRIQARLTAKYRSLPKGESVLQRSTGLSVLEQTGQQLADANYAEALKGYTDLLYNDVLANHSYFQKVKQQAKDNIINRRAATEENPDTYVADNSPELFQEIVKIMKNDGGYDAVNLMVFADSIEIVISQLSSQLEVLSSWQILPSNYLKNVGDKITAIGNTYNQSKKDINLLAKEVTISEYQEKLKEKGVNKEVARNMLSKLRVNTFKDIVTFTKLAYGINAFSNPIVAGVAALIKKAEALTTITTNRKVRNFIKFMRERGLDNEKLQPLRKNKTHHLAPWNVPKFEKGMGEALEKAEAPFLEKISKLDVNDADYLSKKVTLQNQLIEARSAVYREWTASEFSDQMENRVQNRQTENPVTRTKYRTKQAQDFLRAFSRENMAIQDRLKNKPVPSIKDTRARQELHSRKRRAASFYDHSGELKTGEELATAMDIADYFKSFEGTMSSNAKALFEMERRRAEQKLSPEEYARWLQTYAYYGFDPEADLEFATMVVDEDSMRDKFRDNPNLENEIRKEVYNGARMSYQELYEALLEKKRQILAPYRIKNVSGQTDGKAFENDVLGVSALNKVMYLIREFDTEKTDSSDFMAVPNASFIKEYNRLQKESPSLLRDWLRKHGVKENGQKVGGYPVPDSSVSPYYVAYESVGEDAIKKDYYPTFHWEMKQQAQREANPFYNRDLKGKAIQPSQKKMQEYADDYYFELFGISKLDPYGEATRNKELWEARNYMLTEKYFEDKKLGIKNAYFMFPQVRAYANETTAGVFNRNIKDTMAIVTKEVWYVDDQEQDFYTEDGFSSEGRFIPKYFTRLFEDDRIDRLTSDFTFMYGKYYRMSNNYHNKTDILFKVEAMRQTLLNSTVEGSNTTKEELSNTIELVDEYLDSHMYGNNYSKVFGSANAAKRINTFGKLVKLKNMGLNLLVPITSLLVATIQRRTMATEGKYFTQESVNFANSKIKLGGDYAQMLAETGEIDPNSLARKVLEHLNIAFRGEDLFVAGLKNKASRIGLQSNPLYDIVGFKFLARMVAANTGLSVMDNFRLVDGSFISFANFSEQNSELNDSEIKKKWDELKNQTYFSFLVEQDNELVLDEERLRQYGYEGSIVDLQANMNTLAEEANNYVEGQANPLDKNLASKNPIINFAVMMFRTFYQRFLEERLKSRQLNLTTGIEEEGHYRTVWGVGEKKLDNSTLTKGILSIVMYTMSMGMYTKALEYQGMTKMERNALNRIKYDGLLGIGAFALFLLTNLMADSDDDDRFKQYIALLGSRVFTETLSTRWSFGYTSGFMASFDMLESPSAGFSEIERMLNWFELITNHDDVLQSGHYKGKTQLEKAFYKALPIKNVYEPIWGDPRSSNMFYRNKLVGWEAKWLYDKVTSDDIDEFSLRNYIEARKVN